MDYDVIFGVRGLEGPEGPRFVDVKVDGRSIKPEWKKDEEDGRCWRLHLPGALPGDEKIDQALKDRLRKLLEEGIDERTFKAATKKAEDILAYIEDDLQHRMREDLRDSLVGHVEDMASRAVESLLEGNVEQMRRYLHCTQGGYNGRTDGYGQRSLVDAHPIIHGKMSEASCVELRRKLAQAHRDLLNDERIKDLEDQVASLTLQVNKAERARAEMWERVQALS